MSAFLKWAESGLNKIDQMAAGALGEGESHEAPPVDYTLLITELQEKEHHLRNEIESERKTFKNRVTNLHDKYKAQIETLNESNNGLKEENRRLASEVQVIKDTNKKLEDTVSRTEQINQQLLNDLEVEKTTEPETEEESESIEYYKNEHQMAKHQIANLKAMLTSEKIKRDDAIRDKEELEEERAREIEKAQSDQADYEEKLGQAQKELDETKQALEDAKNTERVYTAEQNIQALNEHLQDKQRTIETLLSERAGLVLQLENEKKENLRHMQTAIMAPNRSMSSLVSHDGVKKGLETLDKGVNEVLDTVRQAPMARLGLVLYMVAIHLILLSSMFGGGSSTSQTFLSE